MQDRKACFIPYKIAVPPAGVQREVRELQLRLGQAESEGAAAPQELPLDLQQVQRARVRCLGGCTFWEQVGFAWWQLGLGVAEAAPPPRCCCARTHGLGVRHPCMLPRVLYNAAGRASAAL